VTVIATGYKVDGLPSEEEEEGKKTISEAIEANYPPQVTKPMEDENPQLIDLSETLFAEGTETAPRQPREHAASTSAEDIVITIEDEKAEEEKPEERRGLLGWIRR
jgi:hypothetical protein